MYKKSHPETLQMLFDDIATSYDRTNSILSFGLHRYWNRKLVQHILKSQPKLLLDLCAGTGEIALSFLKKSTSSKAILLDFCPKMLKVAQAKGKDICSRFSILEADAQDIPLESSSVDAITIAYGIRNVKDPKKCFQEAYRLLKSGGAFGILELTRPKNPLLSFMHELYLKVALPLVGKCLSKNKGAYSYLSTSIFGFSSPHEIEQALQEVGFTEIKKSSLTGSIATLVLSRKP